MYKTIFFSLLSSKSEGKNKTTKNRAFSIYTCNSHIQMWFVADDSTRVLISYLLRLIWVRFCKPNFSLTKRLNTSEIILCHCFLFLHFIVSARWKIYIKKQCIVPLKLIKFPLVFFYISGYSNSKCMYTLLT